MRNGFTLVELSIVLVIIGLLIGSILVGQSLIQSARINSIIKQTQQFDIAISNFKNKFKAVPGDANIMPSPGDGDKVFEDSTINSNTFTFAIHFNLEVSNFWYHLAISGFQPDKIVYSNSATTGVRAGVNLPKMAYGNGAYGVASPMPYIQGTVTNRVYQYWISDWEGMTNTQFNSGAIFSYAYTPIEVMAIDQKIDNGTYSGIVSAYAGGVGGACYQGQAYLVNNNKECQLWITMLAQQGQGRRLFD